jgi:hypothetical protein
LKPFKSFSGLILGGDVARNMAWRGCANLEAIGGIPNVLNAEVWWRIFKNNTKVQSIRPPFSTQRNATPPHENLYIFL